MTTTLRYISFAAGLALFAGSMLIMRSWPYVAYYPFVAGIFLMAWACLGGGHSRHGSHTTMS